VLGGLQPVKQWRCDLETRQQLQQHDGFPRRTAAAIVVMVAI